MVEVTVVPPDQFATAALDTLLKLVARHPNPVIGLPTGRTPTPLYEALGAAVRSGRTSIAHWLPFAIDEYVGPRDHPCSNRTYFASYWDPIPGAWAVQQFDPEAADLQAEPSRMSAELERAGGFTVAVLGIGANGHVAFCEPGTPRDASAQLIDLHEASRESARPCWGDATPRRGLTFGPKEIFAAPFVLMIATGAAKAEMVARAIEGEVSPACPASYGRDAASVSWVLDEPAAARLGRA